ncbi:MAG: tetratricopeptide repeat protein [Planctomycetes bacterium]|jgi:hypothetical protein|nr:tetratricopeptide repeat protein [Planctomycetota bacterium]
MNTRPVECRILWFRRNWIGVRDLDSAERFGVSISRANRYIEGEIVTLSPGEAGAQREVFSSRIDPGYGPGPGYTLREYTLPGIDPALGPYWSLVCPVPESVVANWYRRTGRHHHLVKSPVIRIARDLIRMGSPFIEPVHRLGAIEWIRGRKERAVKYLETAWLLGRDAIPPRFSDTLDACHGANTPFFRAGTDYAKALAALGRPSEALPILDFLFGLDRPGSFNGEGMRPPLLVLAGRPDEARAALDSNRRTGVNEFLRALLLLSEGREEEAIHAVCRGMRANPRMVRELAGLRAGPQAIQIEDGPVGFGTEARLHAGLTAPEWRRRSALGFLKGLLDVPGFRCAHHRAVALAKDSDATPPPERSPLVRKKIADCFPDDLAAETARARAEAAGR